MSKKLLIEGWRGINHSYAMVNQYQMLALVKLGIDFRHHDLPFFNPNWNQDQNFCGFDESAIARLNEVKTYTGHDQIDTTYRISFPYRLHPSKSDHLFVFGTSEYQSITNDMIFDDGLKIKNADRPLKIITPSNWSKVGFLNAGFKNEQVNVVPHGVDVSIFKPLSADLREMYRKVIGANKDSFVILSVGGMYPNKGIDLLLEAYVILKEKYPQIRLVLKDLSNLYGIGAKNLVDHFCNKKSVNISAEKITDMISGIYIIAKNLLLSDLNGIYGAADCYVSPYKAEGFNLTPLEAAAAGTPIIVTKGGSTDDYVHQSFALQIESQIKKTKDGYTFLEPSLDSLLASLQNQIEAKNNFINRQLALEYISNGFSWEAVCKKLIDKIDNA
ncbi:glycosyltransferase family 4 protein [Polynucleobacter paneuropaeus]|nr:glycosyltransferase family 4 protein [Polynucleobacter paneuropaeus]